MSDTTLKQVIIELMGEIREQALQPGADAEKLIQQAENRLHAIRCRLERERSAA